MAGVIADNIDWEFFEQETEAEQKVRPASEWAEKLAARFKPAEQRPRAPSMFSTKLGGCIEFRPGEVTCWAGYNGHRKSYFTSQLALDLCVQKSRVMIASFEMPPDATLERMCIQGMATSHVAPTSAEHFMRWTDGRLWLFDHMGVVSPKRCLAVCRYFASELHGRHVFIDSMMMVCESEEHLDQQKKFVTDIVRLAQGTGLHMHLIVHCRKPASGDETRPPSKYDIKGTGSISDQADNVITVWMDKAKKAKVDEGTATEDDYAKPDALVTVEKQRHGRWEGRLRLWTHEDSVRFTNSRTDPVDAYRLNGDLDA
jgi:twinkle protein